MSRSVLKLAHEKESLSYEHHIFSNTKRAEFLTRDLPGLMLNLTNWQLPHSWELRPFGTLVARRADGFPNLRHTGA